MAKRKFRAINTVHYGCYRFEAGTEFTSDDLQPPNDDHAIEPLSEVRLHKWLGSGRVVEIIPKAKLPRKKRVAKAAGAVKVEVASEPEVAKARAASRVKVPQYANWKKEGMKP